MELLQLVYFCSAAETENFAEAAKKCGVPAASISHSVKRLETELGTHKSTAFMNGKQFVLRRGASIRSA